MASLAMYYSTKALTRNLRHRYAKPGQLGRAVFTQDDDFLALANEWLINGHDFAGVIYAEQLGITIGQAIRDLELMRRYSSRQK